MLALLALALESASPAPSPASHVPIAIVIRTDMLPAEKRKEIAAIEADMGRRIVAEDLKSTPPAETRTAEPGEARDLDACALVDADRIVDVDALIIPNENHQLKSQGGHYGELRVAVIDCVAQTVTKANDDTLGRPFENVDRLSPRDFVRAFKELERIVIANYRQR